MSEDAQSSAADHASPGGAGAASGIQVSITLGEAVVYALQLSISALILLVGYHLTGAATVHWAVITVAVVLQPGLKQSLSAAFSRIAANVIGAAVGLLIGLTLGDHVWQFLLALIIVIFICQHFRLGQSLRSACVAVTIVMLSYEGHLVTSSLERTTSVLIGCVIAMVVQYATTQVIEPFFNDE